LNSESLDRAPNIRVAASSSSSSSSCFLCQKRRQERANASENSQLLPNIEARNIQATFLSSFYFNDRQLIQNDEQHSPHGAKIFPDGKKCNRSIKRLSKAFDLTRSTACHR